MQALPAIRAPQRDRSEIARPQCQHRALGPILDRALDSTPDCTLNRTLNRALAIILPMCRGACAYAQAYAADIDAGGFVNDVAFQQGDGAGADCTRPKPSA